MTYLKENWKKMLAAIAVALLIIAGLIEPGRFIQPAPTPTPEAPVFAGGSTGFDSLDLTGNLTTTGNVTAADVTTTDDLAVTDDAVITDDLTAADLIADDWLHLTASSTVAVGAGATITPLGSYQPITSTTGVTTSTSTAIANGSAAGDLLFLRNGNASDAITIDGAGGNVECGGNVALGANDVLTLFWNGSDWTCLALRDN